jgi:hypothetical protein
MQSLFNLTPQLNIGEFPIPSLEKKNKAKKAKHDAKTGKK